MSQAEYSSEDVQEIIKIDPDGKYVLLTEKKLDQHFVDLFTQWLNNWWDSDDKFLVLAGGKCKIVKMDKEDA